MPRSVGSVVNNNFSKGLITEATGLNFPDNAVTDTENTVFEKTGRVTRRLGYDIEGGGTALAYSETDGVLREFIWQSVANSGGFTFLCLQVGDQILFFELSVNDALSKNVVPVAINLRDYIAPGAPETKYIPCSFTSGAGKLFISHPYAYPVVVRFNSEENVFEVAKITVLQRDFQGVEDGLALSANPVTLSSEHHYNLQNQGWNKPVRCGARNNELGGGSSSTVDDPFPLLWQALAEA